MLKSFISRMSQLQIMSIINSSLAWLNQYQNLNQPIQIDVLRSRWERSGSTCVVSFKSMCWCSRFYSTKIFFLKNFEAEHLQCSGLFLLLFSVVLLPSYNCAIYGESKTFTVTFKWLAMKIFKTLPGRRKLS